MPFILVVQYIIVFLIYPVINLIYNPAKFDINTFYEEIKMRDSDADTCCKYAYAIALTGFNGGGIMNENGEIVPVTENMVVNAVNQVHSAWDATRKHKQAILR